MLHAFVIPSRWREWGVTRGTLLRTAPNDAAATEPLYAAGYTLQHMTRLREAGTWDLLMASVVLPGPFHPGDEAEPVALVRAPLTTQIRRLR